MERETKIVTTPAGKELILKAYITAGERNAIREVFYRHIKVNADATMPGEGITGDVMLEAERKTIETVITSYGGSAERVFERLSDERPEEYDAVVAAVNEVTGPAFRKA